MKDPDKPGFHGCVCIYFIKEGKLFALGVIPMLLLYEFILHLKSDDYMLI